MPWLDASMPWHMPGLSNDPEKRARQLAGLAAGRRALALSVLHESPEGAPPAPQAPAPPMPGQLQMTEPAAAATAGGGALGVPVHEYGPPPTPPKQDEQPAPVPVAEDPNAPDSESRAPRSGAVRSFFDGFRHD